MKSVLLLEDENTLAQTLRLSLKKLGYQCTWVRSLREANREISKQQFDLMILDRQLPDGEGLEVLNHPKLGHARALILSSKSSVDERVKGLRAGADDYLAKPFSFHELAARLEALQRRMVATAAAEKTEPPKTGGAVEPQDWELSADTQSIYRKGMGWLELTPLEFKFISYLISRKGVIVSKDRLLRDVWGFSFLPKTRTVDYLVTQLRKRLEKNPDSPEHILTFRGAGIKLVL